MNILVTNDDGIETEGIRVLSNALTELGDVTVVAPRNEQSAVGRSITFRSPLRVETKEYPLVVGHSLHGHSPKLVSASVFQPPRVKSDRIREQQPGQ